MNCKFCNAEVGEEHRFCPYCGKDLAAEEAGAEEVFAPEEMNPEMPAQKPEKKMWKLVLAIAGAVVALAALAVVLLIALGVDIKPRANDILRKDVYTVSDEKLMKKVSNEIALIEDKELTNGELQIYYQEVVYNFINNNYYYLSMYGLDLETPLSEQTCYADESLTWEQYFLNNALESWQRYTTLQVLAEENEFVLDEDLQAFLDELPTSLSEVATAGGHESVADWLNENYGPGVTETDFINYMTTYYTGNAYLESRYEELMPGEEDIESYYTEQEEVFVQNGVGKEDGKYYNVRHILIEIEGGTQNEEGETTYSDAQWEACRVKAQELLDEWLAGDKTEDAFAALANEHSADTGSNTNGGLYSQLTADTNFVEEFKQWYLDETRTVGDTGLVKSTYGYHIMYFSGSEDVWHYNATTQLLAERISNIIDTGIDAHPMKVNYRKIVLSELEF